MNRIQEAVKKLMTDAAKNLQFRQGVSTTSYDARPDVWARAAEAYVEKAHRDTVGTKSSPVDFMKRLAVFEHNFAMRLMSEFASFVSHGSYLAADDFDNYCRQKMVPASQREANELQLMAGRPELVVPEDFDIAGFDADMTPAASEANVAALCTELLLARQLLQQLFYAGYRDGDSLLALSKQDEDRLLRFVHRELMAQLERAYQKAAV